MNKQKSDKVDNITTWIVVLAIVFAITLLILSSFGCASSQPVPPSQPPPLPTNSAMGFGGGEGNSTAALVETTTLADPIVHLRWFYPTSRVDSIEAFCVYSTTNLTQTVTNWPKIATVTNLTPFALSGTNAVFNLDFAMFPEQRFFSVTASNFWLESDPSNTARTPHPPLLIEGLNVSR